jgi:hypothetical protein
MTKNPDEIKNAKEKRIPGRNIRNIVSIQPCNTNKTDQRLNFNCRSIRQLCQNHGRIVTPNNGLFRKLGALQRLCAADAIKGQETKHNLQQKQDTCHGNTAITLFILTVTQMDAHSK